MNSSATRHPERSEGSPQRDPSPSTRLRMTADLWSALLLVAMRAALPGRPWDLPSCRRRCAATRVPAWLLMSEVSSPGGAGEAAALVLATQEFVANGGGRPSDRRRRVLHCRGARVAGPCWSPWLVAFPSSRLTTSAPPSRHFRSAGEQQRVSVFPCKLTVSV